ncbi:MAG: hypothetical protein Q4F21_15135 [Lachnospiraceae bacterium]|nr:hypothetical protein [Lachnospiraceae bacterium]
MLGKLFKYDLKEMGTYYIPLYIIYAGIAAAFSILMAIALHSDLLADNTLFSLIFGIISIAFVLAIASLLILSGLIVIYYFYRKFVSQEAYLTMTLPVRPWQHIVSKLLSGAVWQLLSWLVFIISLLCALFASGGINTLFGNSMFWGQLGLLWTELCNEIGLHIGSAALFIIYIVLSLLTSPLVYFASISIGQMSNKNKVLWSVISFVGINIVISLFTAGSSVQLSVDNLTQFLMISMVQLIVTSAVFFAITLYSLSKRLNLE